MLFFFLYFYIYLIPFFFTCFFLAFFLSFFNILTLIKDKVLIIYILYLFLLIYF